MAILVITGAGYGTPLSGCRCTFVTSGGDIYVFLHDDTNKKLRVYKKTNSSFSEQDSGDAPTDVTYEGFDGRCDGTLIHIAYYSATGTVSYVTFNTGTDQWGTPETIDDTCEAEDSLTRRNCVISLDSADKPHVAYLVKSATYHGGNYHLLYYKNKTGAAWSAREMVSLDESNQINNDYPSAAHDSQDRFIVVWLDFTSNNAEHRSRSSAGSWDTQNTIAGVYTGHPFSLTVDNNDVKKVAYSDDSGFAQLDIMSGTSGANPTWSLDGSDLDMITSYPSIACKPGGTDLYVVYREAQINDILMCKKEGGSWSSPITLESNYFLFPVIQDPTGADGFCYIFWEQVPTAQVWWNEYSFVAVPDGTIYVEKETGRRTQQSNSFSALKLDPGTGRRGTDTNFSKYIVKEVDGRYVAKSA